jgi:hypothetical protein
MSAFPGLSGGATELNISLHVSPGYLVRCLWILILRCCNMLTFELHEYVALISGKILSCWVSNCDVLLYGNTSNTWKNDLYIFSSEAAPGLWNCESEEVILYNWSCATATLTRQQFCISGTWGLQGRFLQGLELSTSLDLLLLCKFALGWMKLCALKNYLCTVVNVNFLRRFSKL